MRRRARQDGSTRLTYRTRYTDPVTGKRVVRTFDRLQDAEDFRAQIRLLRRGGQLDQLTRSRTTVAEFVEIWWRDHATRELSQATLRSYRSIWHAHALPRVGALELGQITPQLAAQLTVQLERDGVGRSSIARTLSMMQGVLSRAVEWGYLPSNPWARVRKPKPQARRATEPLSPQQVEHIRRVLLDEGDHMSATLCSVLAYAGLRPQEALALEWRHIGKNTLLVEQKVNDGRIVAGQKTSRPPRSVDLLDHLRRDLAEYRMRCGRPGNNDLLFERVGRPWREYDVRNWRRRTYRPAAIAAGISSPRPYDLRHSFASLMLQEGRLGPAELADQLGHGLDMLFRTYAHVIREVRGQAGVPADELIAAARANQSPASGSAVAN